MKSPKSKVFSIAQENPVVPDCTTSFVMEEEAGQLLVFAMGEGTDIREEFYDHGQLYLVQEGTLDIHVLNGETYRLNDSMGIVMPANTLYELIAPTDCVFIEMKVEETNMKHIESSTIFSLKDLLPIQEGRVVNKDILSDNHVKIVLMSLDAGTKIPEHAAPGEALFFCLEGDGVIVNEGTEHPIHEGQNFVFEKGKKHEVRANTPFKMALILFRN